VTEIGFYELIAVLAGPFLALWLANRWGQKPEWSIDTWTFFKYSLTVILGGIILPSVILWVIGGPLQALLSLVLLAGLDCAVYIVQKKRRIKKRESDLAFLRERRENGDDESPFAFLDLR